MQQPQKRVIIFIITRPLDNALSKGISVLRQKDAAAGELATTIFDGLLNRHEQRRISKHA